VFAGLLNKGFRGSLVLLISLYLVSAVLVYFAPVALEQEYYPNLFYNYFAQYIDNKFLILLVNFLFIGIGVLLVSLIAVNEEIVDKQNYFPVFLYLLLCVVSVNPLQVTSQIFTNIFVLFSVYRLLNIYRKENALKEIFEAAFWLCCSAFITISSIISFPLFFIILLILRPFNWREWSIALLGFFMPLFMYESMAYLSDFNRWYLPEATLLFFQYLRVPSFSEYYLPLTVTLIVLLVFSVFYYLGHGFGNTVKKQKTKAILLWFLFFSLFGFFSGGANSSSILLTYAFPLAFFIGDYLFSMKRIKITNTILAIVLFCAALIFAGEFRLI
jgi:hypothetical protein